MSNGVLGPIFGKELVKAVIIAMTVAGLSAAAIIGSYHVGAQKTARLADDRVKTIDNSISGPGAGPCVPSPIGLVSAWSGDGNALDARSRNNGTIQNGVTFVPGHTGQAFDLAGNSGDRILIGNPPGLRLMEFTIEAWIKRSSAVVVTNSPGGTAGVLLAYGQNGYGLYLHQDNNKLAFGQIGQSDVVAPNFAITDTNWHHVAVTHFGPPFTAGSQTLFYLDGVMDAPVGYAPLFTFSTNAAIGARGDGQTDNVFYGAIDEVAIYDRPLTNAQIAGIYNAGTSGKCRQIASVVPDDQVVWLTGDGDANSVPADGPNGTLQNGAGFAVGNVGQSFRLDGVDDYVLIPQAATHDVGTSGGFTIETWVDPADGNKNPLVEWGGGGSYGVHLWLGLSCPSFPCSNPPVTPGALYANLIDTSNNNHQFGTAVSVASTNAWTHVAITYDKLTGVGVLYVNGMAVETRNLGVFTPKTNLPLNIGARPIPDPGGGCGAGGDCFYNGKLDEVSIYDRALSADEIKSVADAGAAGKYKVQATVPANIAAWYPADGDTNDLQAGNTATLQGGTTYGPGKVGQAFSFNGTSAYMTAPSSAANDPTGALRGASMEAWVYFNQRPSDAGRQFYIMSKNGVNPTEGFDIHVDPDNFFKFVYGDTYAGFPREAVQTGRWYHVAAIFSPAEPILKFYVDGVLWGTAAVSGPRTASNAPLTIGRDVPIGSTSYFDGKIDEPAIYDRALTLDEIRDQFYAGSLGKYKNAANPAVSNKARAGDAQITFGTITAAGAVHQIPLDQSLFAPLPAGTATGLTYDISTTAPFSGTATVCFNVPSFSPAQYSALAVYHLESGVWQNRTGPSNTYPNLCTSSLTSLSPFAIALGTPSAAEVSVSGRVMTPAGEGLRNAVVSMTDSRGVTQTALSSSLGYYRFDAVATGETFILSAQSKRYQFAARAISVTDDLTGVDLMAEP